MVLSRAIASAAALAAIACIAAPPAALAGPAGDGATGRICAGTLGLDPGEKHYDACVQSLSGSLANLQAGRSMAAARRICLARGLAPGAADFDECELSTAHAGPASVAVDDRAERSAGRSYFATSRDGAWRRDERACARLGFDPAGAAFQSCAADLRGALARASMPAM